MLKKLMSLRSALVALTALICCAPAPTLLAATGEIEEIVVTATKREQSIQDVPIAVSAFSGEDLDARGVQDLLRSAGGITKHFSL